MAAPKGPESGTRRIWRMTADLPMGEYLELVPKDVQSETPAPPKRILHPEAPTTNRAVAAAQRSTDYATAASPTTATAQGAVPRQVQSRREAPAEAPAVLGSKVKVLRPAQVESWQSSSFDRLTGLVVRDVTDTIPDVTDTIPGQVFEELFPHRFTGRSHPGLQRRR